MVHVKKKATPVIDKLLAKYGLTSSPTKKAAKKKPAKRKNPAKRNNAIKYHVVDQEQGGLWHQIAFFTAKKNADEYARAIYKRSPTHSVRVVFTYPATTSKAAK